MGSRVRLLLAVAGTTAAVLLTPLQQHVAAQIGPGILISEFRFIGTRGTNDEFVELFNASDTAVNLSGWTIRAANNADAGTSLRVTIGNVTVQPGCYYLIANSNPVNGPYSGTVPADLFYNSSIPDDGGVAVLRSNGTIADQVGFFNTTTNIGFSTYFEGTRINVSTPIPLLNQSYERKPDLAFIYRDTTNNANDFANISPARPQNRTSPCARLTKFPNEIQGAGASSPLVPGTAVNVRGIVTALKPNGFFMQTEPANDDGDPNTSEGLFVEYAGAVQTGRVVLVGGKVSEFGDVGGTMTGVNAVTNVNDLGAATRPASVVLTSAELSDTGSFAQLERFEGMRVSVAQLSAVSGSDLNNAFFAVRTGQSRPFREPGVHAAYQPLPCAQAPCNVPVFDGNPELLRVDADGLSGVAAVTVSTGAIVSNLTGPLEFAGNAYTLLPEAPLVPSGGMSMVAAAPPAADQFTVASLNLGASYAGRLAKASLAIRDALSLPDIIGVQGVATAGDLAELAAQVNTDAGGAVHYDAQPSGGNPADPLGVGFLVRSDRVSNVSTDVVVSTAFNNAPVVLHATVTGPAILLPEVLTIVNSQFAPLAGVERDDATGAAARATRQAQSQALADYVQGRQVNDPNEAIVALGDYNAFDFNDGYVDVVGTVRGVPAPANALALASPPLVFPTLSNADATSVWSEQYSSVSNGSAGSLDHVLINTRLSARVAGLVHARINADFPNALSGDATTPLRVSDRDPLVVYFTFPPDVDGPTFGAVSNVTAEATGPDGAVVTFSTPAAEDNLDGPVAVNCSPVSGTQFVIGNTGVTCSAQDQAGNASSVSFTVTVADTTPPVLVVPGDQLLEATSSSGAPFNFAATATDVVTASLTVLCSASSGTFAVGTTPVNCSTQDAAGNNASAAFTVTVQDTTKPVVSVPANIVAEAASAAGVAVDFSASASDAVTTVLNVVCSPLAGSTFALGTTTVTCVTQDNAGNTASASFTVTVRDTTAPALLVPSPITAEATSTSGRVVLFSATATDAVTELPAVSCTPASGSTFPVGATTVNCLASDAAGNSSSGSFTVTVTPLPVTTVVPGHMSGLGDLGIGTGRVSFVFDVRESAYYERGWVTLTIGTGWRRDYLTSSHIEEVQFANSDGYSPGVWPRSGVDTVVFKGTACWNGRRGYRFEITATDRGEPGAGLDTFALTVYSSTGAVVASVSGTLHNGNIQSTR